MSEEYRSVDISQAARALMVFAPGEWRFKMACHLMKIGFLRACAAPLEDDIHERLWLKILLNLAGADLIDEGKITDVTELDIGEIRRIELSSAYTPTFKAMIRWRQKVDTSIDFYRDIDEENPLAAQIYDSILCSINGTQMSNGDRQIKREYDWLLFFNNKDLGVVEFNPWVFKNLEVACKHQKLPTITGLFQHVDEIVKTVNDLLESNEGSDERMLKELSEFYVKYGKPLKDDCGQKDTQPRMPLPPPPTPPKQKTDESGTSTDNSKEEKTAKRICRLTSEAKGDFTVYKDSILGESYEISNGTKAKGTIEKYFVQTLTKDVTEWNVNWHKFKGQFLRNDARRFKDDQVVHEHVKNGKGEETKRQTGRWRVKTDDEIKAYKKERLKLKKGR